MIEESKKNERIERTAEVRSSAPKTDAKPSEENIHDKGRKAVHRLAALLREWAIIKGWRIEVKVNPPTTSGPDIEIKFLDLDWTLYIEVKQGNTGTSQVRPYEYLPVVVWGENTEKWYVFSPAVIMEKAGTVAGQGKLADPYVSCNIGRPGSTPRSGCKQFWPKAECKPEDLLETILSAYYNGEKNPEYKELAADVEAAHNSVKESNSRKGAKLPPIIY